MSDKQRTIAAAISVSGIGLHTGKPVSMTCKPAPVGHGIVFVRTDLPGSPPIPALVDHVIEIARGTVLGIGSARIHTVEHVLAAVAGLRIDNLIIELTDEEPPAMDGSAFPFIEAMRKAEVVEQEADRIYLELEKTLTYHDDKNAIDIVMVPSSEFRITYMIDYPNTLLGTQYTSMYSICEFIEEFSKARTFCLLSEMQSLKERGLIKGGSLENAVVFVDQKLDESSYAELKSAFGFSGELRHSGNVLGDIALRYPNEPVRHKALDLVGDLVLVGAPLKCHVLAARAGHASHVEVAKMLRRVLEAQKVARKFGGKSGQGYVFDSEAIERLLPHKYPMLLVDRILELVPNERVVGIKNVTRNEPFFNGHFPGHPVMPGVLIVEAMGQTGGVLLLNSVEKPETKVVYFTGLENVKFRKPVTPGDQIRFTVEMLLFRRGICKMKGTAHVDETLVAEAEMTAAVIDRQG
ncbi:MAG: bifunctional UDP-3-O-[3-hydroxymyristoyl] N-acetylglucosamine deacetylase/3-hydroxyacyl-ACP dehydratase [bacterium]|nr:bifunctional UDP-3-O-[3-hydroxymyristoyl] N-acetylglucosamine deacetylase/3-hydroxyacyl-ACP dehydratase [bacterium]